MRKNENVSRQVRTWPTQESVDMTVVEQNLRLPRVHLMVPEGGHPTWEEITLYSTAALRGHVKKIIYLVPTTLLSRSHDIRSRAHGIRSRAHDIRSRAHDIRSRAHDIIISFPRHNYLVPTT